jgi:hypothetical protein
MGRLAAVPLVGMAFVVRAWAPGPIAHFKDVTRAAGIEFIDHKGSSPVATILEEAEPGVCVADYDGDGFIAKFG